MKKNTINIYLIVFVTYFFVGCNDDFLERYPLDEISSETFWNTEEDLKLYNNYFYHRSMYDWEVPILNGHTQGFAGRGSIWYDDYASDNTATTFSGNSFWIELKTAKNTPPETTADTHGSYTGWDFVRAINIGLANYGKANIAQDIINKYIGEARLFRGWFYAEKVSKFGDVQWIDNELNIDSEELYGPRTPREEVMEKVLEDLDFATTYIPDDWEDGLDPGRLDRWAALLVKSRVCLFEGTWRKYHGGTNPQLWLEEAASAAKELIENGPYSLYSTGNPSHDYNAYHRMMDLTGNPEVIYWRKYDPEILTIQVSAQHYRRYGGVSRNMVEDYLCTDGLPITLSSRYMGDATIEDVFKNRDPRLRQTVLHPDDGYYYEVQTNASYPFPRIEGMSNLGNLGSTTGYHEIKHFIRKDFNLGAQGYVPAISLRFGEALLNYAEAKAELETMTQADLDISINKLRDRVGMIHMTINSIPVDPRYVSDGISPLIAEIRRERRVELYGEGFRYNDLRRWKQGKKLEKPTMGILWDSVAKARYKGANVLSSIDSENGKSYIQIYKGTTYETVSFDESKYYLWPIPLSILSENSSIKQNPGW
jgi:hypothetical protein